ncbi:RNA polymerase factor sigma-54 [Solirhodobacter olei]|uniref:RNA polymerase factor sigma-54 n=1 Tax=Solirhodobacter olei TaxID=2493082 RepID=UPI000FDCB1C9|nr:RNA polymerase factor sigma-54 [Solirhodobacter olei]
MAMTPSLGISQRRTLSMTTSLRQAIGLLKYNNAELHTFLAKTTEANVFLELTPPPVTPPRRPVDPGGRAIGRKVWNGTGSDGIDLLGRPAASLVEHVAQQISLSLADPGDRHIAFGFLEALEPYGWLGETAEEIAEARGCSVEAAERVLDRLQLFEPSGLFARSLTECLRLQARDKGVLSDDLAQILDNLAVLAEDGPDRLAEVCGISLEAVQDHLAIVRSFDPKPGARFLETGEAPIRPPDLLTERTRDGWRVELNGTTLPTIVVRDDRATDKETRTPTEAEALTFARDLKRAVDQRNATALRVASEVVRRQSAFLSDPQAPPAPLSLQNVAEAIGMHASTVSRIVRGMTIDTPRGLLELRRCFARGLPAEDGNSAWSIGALKRRIGEMIGAEDKTRPLSDAALCAALQANGIRVERRTVAKYRDELGLPSSVARAAAARRRPRA